MPPIAENRKQTIKLMRVPSFWRMNPAKKMATISLEMLITPVRYTCSN